MKKAELLKIVEGLELTVRSANEVIAAIEALPETAPEPAQTEQELRICKIKAAITDNDAAHSLIENEVDGIHEVLKECTDERQWDACRMHLYHNSNIRLENDEFIIQWNDFCGIDSLVTEIIEAIENS